MFLTCVRKASKLGWSREYTGSISRGLSQYLQANVRIKHKFPPWPLPCISFVTCYTLSFIELLDPAKPKLLVGSLNKLQMKRDVEMLCGPLLVALILSCLLGALTEGKHTGRTYDSCTLLIRNKSRLRNFVETFCKEHPVLRFKNGLPSTLPWHKLLCFMTAIGL